MSVSEFYVRAIQWPGEKELSAIILVGVALLLVAALLLAVGWLKTFARALGVVGVVTIWVALFAAHQQTTIERISPLVTATRPKLPEEVRQQILYGLIGLPAIAALVMSMIAMVSWKRKLLTVPGHLREGLQLYHARDYDKALTEYNKALAISPDRAEALFQRGRVHEAKADIELALADYDRAIECDPRLVGAVLHRGKLRNDRGDLDGALADFERADILRPNNPEVFLNRGICFKKLGILRGAKADFERVLNLTNHTDFADPAKKFLVELESLASGPDPDATLAGDTGLGELESNSNPRSDQANGNGKTIGAARVNARD